MLLLPIPYSQISFLKQRLPCCVFSLQISLYRALNSIPIAIALSRYSGLLKSVWTKYPVSLINCIGISGVEWNNAYHEFQCWWFSLGKFCNVPSCLLLIRRAMLSDVIADLSNLPLLLFVVVSLQFLSKAKADHASAILVSRFRLAKYEDSSRRLGLFLWRLIWKKHDIASPRTNSKCRMSND